jgi:hypothetical protein
MQSQAVVAFLGSCLVAGLSQSGRAQDVKEQAVKKDLQSSGKDRPIRAGRDL